MVLRTISVTTAASANISKTIISAGIDVTQSVIENAITGIGQMAVFIGADRPEGKDTRGISVMDTRNITKATA